MRPATTKKEATREHALVAHRLEFAVDKELRNDALAALGVHKVLGVRVRRNVNLAELDAVDGEDGLHVLRVLADLRASGAGDRG